MPGQGRPPKDPGQRRRYNQPARGEWVDLEPLEKPILPAYKSSWRIWIESRDRQGNPITVRRGVSRAMWAAWRESPVTSQYGPEDIAAVCYLAETFHSLSDTARLTLLDRLGLTPKGKRDLRWRTPAEVKTIAAQEQPSVKRLRVVEQEAG
jgi:hypothetical protein